MEPTWLAASAFFGVSMIVAAIGCGIAASLMSVSLRKGKLQLAASLLVGGGCCICSVTGFLVDQRRPVFEASGYIESAEVHRAGKSYRTKIRIRMSSGAVVHVNASARSEYFRPGEHIETTYRGYTGTIIKARFYTPSGVLEGQFNGTDTLGYLFVFAIGVFLIFAGVVKFRRDPEAAEVSIRRQNAPQNGVDAASLLNISDHR